VLLACKPLFLGGGDDPSVFNKGGGAVVVEGRDAEDPHGSEKRIDEGSDSGPLRKNEKATEKRHHHQEREKPKLPARA
jgi:hypothetical protein